MITVFKEDSNEHFNGEPRSLRLNNDDNSVLKTLNGPHQCQMTIEQDGSELHIDLSKNEMRLLSNELLKMLYPEIEDVVGSAKKWEKANAALAHHFPEDGSGEEFDRAHCPDIAEYIVELTDLGRE